MDEPQGEYAEWAQRVEDAIHQARIDFVVHQAEGAGQLRRGDLERLGECREMRPLERRVSA